LLLDGQFVLKPPLALVEAFDLFGELWRNRFVALVFGWGGRGSGHWMKDSIDKLQGDLFKSAQGQQISPTAKQERRDLEKGGP
jgi:hypothetical protein